MTDQKKNSSLVKRHVVAAVFLPLFVAYLYILPPSPFFLALLIMAGLLALWEFCAMYRVPPGIRIPAVLLGGVMLYLLSRYPEGAAGYVFISFFLLVLIRLFTVKNPSGCMSEIGPAATGLLYVAGLLSFQWYLRMEPHGMEYIFILYTSVWMADAGAFYTGTYFGKNKLYPSISPNKTWEGALGSLLGGAVGTVIIKSVFALESMTLGSAALTGALIGIAALVGDLIESLFKRDAGVKDSSVLIPGHGGLLDKLDGMLAAAPMLYFIVRQ